MAKATKLPSGNWRVLVYANGHRKSFTAPTKKEAEYQASQWLMSETESEDATIKDAIERFINNRSAINSPTTILAYRSMQKNCFSEIENKNISKIKSEDIQKFINNLSKDYSPKYVKNAYGLLRASIQALNPNKPINVRLPQSKPIEYRLPTDEDIKKLLETADNELRLAIMLAAMGTLREGEVCALQYEDIKGNTIHVHQNMIFEGKKYIIKDIPKTQSSDRYITYPKNVIKEIGKGEGLIFQSNPKAICNRYRRLVKRCNLDISTRFHDLRHYAASAMHAMGIPDQYIMEVGGWKSDTVLKSVYRNTLDDRRKEFEEIRNKYMDSNFF